MKQIQNTLHISLIHWNSWITPQGKAWTNRWILGRRSNANAVGIRLMFTESIFQITWCYHTQGPDLSEHRMNLRSKLSISLMSNFEEEIVQDKEVVWRTEFYWGLESEGPLAEITTSWQITLLHPKALTHEHKELPEDHSSQGSCMLSPRGFFIWEQPGAPALSKVQEPARFRDKATSPDISNQDLMGSEPVEVTDALNNRWKWRRARLRGKIPWG